MYDIIIENGKIVDGTGNPWYKADIGVKDGKIAAIGRLENAEAKERLDAAGAIVAPGFIDIHCHSDALLFLESRSDEKIMQGVTTEVIGNCGISSMPTTEKNLALLKKYTASIFARIELPWNWRTVGDFLDRIEQRRVISNVATLVGHGTVRIAVMGFDNREPEVKELRAMKELVKDAMTDGAFGLSSGLIYPPGVFSKPPEMIELCKPLAEKGGFYATHMRSETDGVIDSVRETVEVAIRSGASVHISHHKAAGKNNWGKSRKTLQLVDEARQSGLDITCDAYPYLAGSTMLGALLPPWTQEGGVNSLLARLEDPVNRLRIKKEIASGLPSWDNFAKAAGWDNILIASCTNNKACEGLTLQKIAETRGIDPVDAVCELMIEEKGDVLMVPFLMCEDDLTHIVKHPAVMIASDAIPSPGKPHPRNFGTFARLLAKYVRQDSVLSLPEAVRKISSMPAQRLGLKDRGLLREGLWADITIFDADKIEDKATYTDSQQYPSGINYVLVNGQVAVRQGKYTGSLSGKVLRKEN